MELCSSGAFGVLAHSDIVSHSDTAAVVKLLRCVASNGRAEGHKVFLSQMHTPKPSVIAGRRMEMSAGRRGPCAASKMV